MSKLQELIQRLCPKGVEFKRIGDVAEILRGRRLTKKELTDDAEYPVFHGGIEPIGYYTQHNRPANTVMIINVGASAGTVGFSDKPFWSSDGCYCIGKSELLIDKYLYFLLAKNQIAFVSKVRHAGIPTLDSKVIANYEIPVPPMPVQQEIVRILNKFTSLEAELEAELDCRKRQYEYYRNQLLTFAPPRSENEKWMTLGDIGEVCMCKRIMKHQTSETGDIPFYKIGTFGGEPDAYIDRSLYEEYKMKYSFPKKGDILISAAGTIGRAVIYDGMDAYFQDSNIVWIDNNESILLNKYLYYLYSIIEWKTEGGTIKRLYNGNLKATKVAVPSKEEQRRIVSILDRFEALTTDLQSGLPAEIAARRQQYEYYREKLLTFKRRAA